MTEKSFSVDIRAQDRPIVSIDRFGYHDGEVTFLFGESGIGKSLLSKAVYGILDQDALAIIVDRQPYGKHCAKAWTKEIQQNSFFVFQEPSSHLNPLMKISHQMTEGSLAEKKFDTEILQYLWQTKDDAHIRSIIDIFPKPYRPSGGEKQRVLLAMAFKKISFLLEQSKKAGANFFVFDEPTGSLDDNYRNLFLKLLFTAFERQPFTVMIITHDYSIISEIYKSYRHLLDKVHFKELSRKKEHQVVLNDFSTKEYLHWLYETGQREVAQTTSKQVLKVKSSFSIFDRSLQIHRDRGRTMPVDLEIRQGEMVYLKAPSGIGKTTLAKIIMGLYRPQKFSMDLDKYSIDENTPRSFWYTKLWGKKTGMVFQHADEALNLQAKVKETFKGLPIKGMKDSSKIKKRLQELFDGELSDSFINKRVAFLSGGQKQRLNLLRTLVMNTDLTILDEPLNGLDFVSIKKVLALLEEKRKQGSAFLIISHNEEIFDTLINTDQVYYLSQVK